MGSTAVMVAAARATETASADPLIRDEFAEVLIGTPELAELRANVSSSWVNGAPDQDDHQGMVTYQAVRTHFFDEYFGGAVGAGIQGRDVGRIRRETDGDPPRGGCGPAPAVRPSPTPAARVTRPFFAEFVVAAKV